MGAHSTLRITRSKAKEELLKLVQSELSDEQLKQLMDMILYERLRNATIVADDAPNDDDCV